VEIDAVTGADRSEVEDQQFDLGAGLEAAVALDGDRFAGDCDAERRRLVLEVCGRFAGPRGGLTAIGRGRKERLALAGGEALGRVEIDGQRDVEDEEGGALAAADDGVGSGKGDGEVKGEG